MTKNEFINRLKSCLSPLSEEERDNAVRYYEEFFEDCESEEEALNQLGSPEEIAKQILKENGINTENVATAEALKKEKSKNMGLIILIVILTFPLWIGAVALAFGLTVAAFAISFALNVSFIAVGVSCIGAGCVMLFTGTSLGLVLLGIGLVAISLFILIMIPFAKSMLGTIKKFINFVKEKTSKLFRKGAN